MPAVSISPQPKLQFFDAAGDPLVGGKLYTYAAGTTTPLASYTDSTGNVANANPVVLDSRGEASVWLAGAQYKLALYTASNVLVWTVDGVGGPDQATLAALAASGGSALIGFLQAGTGAVTRTAQSKMRDTISVFDFMTAAQISAVQTNNYSVVTGAEITAACQAALTAAVGRTLLFPAGTYVITSTLTYQPAAYVSAFGPGVRVIGDGVGSTIFDNRVNGPMISMITGSTSGSFQGALGAVLEGFKITRTTSTSSGVGIYMTAAYNATVRNVHIIGMSSHGIQIPCVLGDNDGSNMVRLDHVRIENCAGWGVKADGNAGFNETSFMYLQHVFIQACGTTNAAYQPPSGGMIWKGQILTMMQCAFTLNENAALWIPGAAGLAQTVDIQSTTFENNKARSFFCRGVSAFKARNIQFYNNNSYTSTVGCEFDGAAYVIRQVDINGVVVRATDGNNPYTAFKISGANAQLNTCRVRNVVWENFDYTGQTRFDGWQFDPVPNNCQIVVASSTDVTFKPNQYIGTGNKVPFRLIGPTAQSSGGVASTSGEWVTLEVPSSGFAVPLAGVLANTRYWCYLYDNAGAPAIEVSSSASQVTDTTSGYAVKSADPTRYYIGSILGGGTNATAATTGIGWLNPTVLANGATNAVAYLWSDSSGKLRIKSSGTLPSSDTDGTIVGTQT